jgi:hypothetical protein
MREGDLPRQGPLAADLPHGRARLFTQLGDGVAADGCADGLAHPDVVEGDLLLTGAEERAAISGPFASTRAFSAWTSRRLYSRRKWLTHRRAPSGADHTSSSTSAKAMLLNQAALL